MFYVYRCTTDKLEHHLNRIIESGDELSSTHYMGGRDWILIGRQLAVGAADVPDFAAAVEQGVANALNRRDRERDRELGRLSRRREGGRA